MSSQQRDQPVVARTHLCLRCRRLVSAGEPCPYDASHAVVDLSRPDGRMSLTRAARHVSRSGEREHVVRWFARTLGQLTGNGAFPALAAVMGLILGISGLLGVMYLWLVIVPFVVLYHAVKDGPSFPRLHREGRVALLGARVARPLLPAAEPLRGVVAGECALIAPGSDTECVAYSVQLVCDDAELTGVMFCDMVTCGFTVELADGRRVRVPAGTVELLPEPEPLADMNPRSIHEHLAAIARELVPEDQRPDSEQRAPLSFDRVRERVVVPGDRVEVCAPVRTEFEGGGGYREAPTQVLVAEGVPVIAVLADPGGVTDALTGRANAPPVGDVSSSR